MKTLENKEVCELVREMEEQFTNSGGTQTSKYVRSDLHEDINTIYAYLDSKHISGSTDSQGREKPFFNIVTAARNIWYRATDIDRKHVNVRATKEKEVIPALLATVLLQNWMRKEDFGSFLNKWGIDLASFNSVVVKFVENSEGLHPMVVPWNRIIVDPIDFDANPKIEILELTEAQLYQRKNYDKEMVEKLCEALESRETIDHQDKDQKDNYIRLYEIHGNLPLSYLTGKDKDEDKYVQQMHVVSFVASKEKGQFDDFTLYSGREEQDPYMLTSLLPATDGSISLNGAVKNLFEAQWMMNHTVKSIKDQLDVASKLLFQTSDKNYVGRNVLSAIEQGDILIHDVNQPLTQVNNASHDITAQQSFGQMWKGLSNEINGISESMLGIQSKSGTAWRQIEAELAEAHSLFELMTENKGLCLERMLRVFVIPYLKKQMDTTEEVTAILDAHMISKIDAMYVPAEAARRFNHNLVEKTIKYLESDDPNDLPLPYDKQSAEQGVRDELAPLGNQRFFKPSDIPTKTWKQVLKDLEWELEADITGEQTDNQVVLTTLNTMLSVVANPNFANNPQAQLIIGKILQRVGGVSPIELAQISAPNPVPTAAPPQPVGLTANEPQIA